MLIHEVNETHILWDSYGIPHIHAPDHRRLFHAYGYAQMEAHGELLTRLYAQGRGRAAEFYGAAWLEDDRWVRTNGIPQRAARWAAQQSAEFAPLLRAFVAGLNASATSQAESLSTAARGVLPFTVADVLAHTMRVINFEWYASRQRVASRLSESGAAPSESNGWAIGPSKSASGNVMLLSNSHLHWGDRNTYFEVQLAAPGVTSYGAVWVGFPVLRQCFTEYLGWTQTTNPPNLATLYRLSLTDGGYGLDGSTQPFAVERQVLKVLRDDGTVDSEPLTIRRCAHGPVVAEEQGEAVALRVARHRPAADAGAILAHGPGAQPGAVPRPPWPCSSSRCSTPCTATATGTSCTCTTPRCRCASPPTSASGAAWCRATTPR